MAIPMIDIINLNKTFDNGTHSISEINLSIKKGEFISIIGGSGSGKSTLLRCINRLVTPSSGEIFFKGSDVCIMDRPQLTASRKHMGMIFQQFNLMKGRVLRYITRIFVRLFLNTTRSIETLVWAIIFSVWVGIGPFRLKKHVN
jgi:ABC-type phosphate/phosphonate transport system ATPase subunit